MGIIKRGILGGFSNKVANVVGTSWKGRAVIKSVPLSVANPRTTPQVNQRTKFKSAIKFASPILGQWIKPLFDRFSGDIAGINKWMSLNVVNFSQVGFPIYQDLKMCEGKMLAPSIANVNFNLNNNQVTVDVLVPFDNTWGSPVEYAYVLAVNSRTEEKQVAQASGSQGGTIICELAFSEMQAGDDFWIYAALKRGDNTQVSNSIVGNYQAI